MKFFQVLLLSCFVLISVSAWSNPANCGVRREPPPTEAHLGVYNGEIALPHEFPWMVSLNESDLGHACGGAILNERWILTAAHCLEEPKSKFIIIAGAHNLANPKEGAVIRSAQEIFPHERYNKSAYDYDIGLIKLSESLDLNSPDGTVRPVCLPTPLESLNLHAGDLATASGWGVLEDGPGENWSPLLHKVNLTIDSNEFCARDIVSWNQGNIPLTRRMICANGRGLSDTCHGDSGSPLSIYTEGKWTVYGIVSFGGECTGRSSSGVYTRVTELMPWIEKTIANN